MEKRGSKEGVCSLQSSQQINAAGSNCI